MYNLGTHHPWIQTRSETRFQTQARRLDSYKGLTQRKCRALATWIMRSLSCCHFGPYSLLSCCHFGSSHRALSCSNFQPSVDLGTDLLLEEIFLQMSQPPVRYPRSPYTSTGGFTYIPEDQKIWCGNLSRGLTSEDMTEWLKYHQYEVPIPLDVVQQGY